MPSRQKAVASFVSRPSQMYAAGVEVAGSDAIVRTRALRVRRRCCLGFRLEVRGDSRL